MKTPTMSYGMKTAPKLNAGTSKSQGTATGSGSRPGGGSYPIASSAPKNAKRIRG